jgi:hypothetical protein
VGRSGERKSGGSWDGVSIPCPVHYDEWVAILGPAVRPGYGWLPVRHHIPDINNFGPASRREAETASITKDGFERVYHDMTSSSDNRGIVMAGIGKMT